jgi:IS1 family transposase
MYDQALPAWQHQPRQRGGPTNHVEQFNATVRPRLGRLVRKTLSFAKSANMLEIVLRLFLHQCNSACPPK